MYDTAVFPGEHGHFLTTFRASLEDPEKPLSWPVHDRRGITDVRYVVKNLPETLELPGGVYNFGSENGASTYDTVKAVLEELGLEAGEYVVTDVWTGEQYTMNDRFTTNVEFHGSRLLAITKAGEYKLYDANIRINSAAVCDNVMTLEADYKYDDAQLLLSTAPKAIAFEGKALEFTKEGNLTKFAVPGKGKLTITF
jgi:hypothetical protein